MLIISKRQKSARKRLFLFGRNERGATAVEFAILALPFFLLIFNTLESAYSFAGRQMMANAADNVSRQFRTGQVTTITAADLKTMVCNEIKLMVPAGCPGLLVDLRSEGTFQALTQVSVDDKGIVTGGPRTDLGPALSKNMLHVVYKWPIFTDLFGRFQSQIPGESGKMLIFATAIWQNEPF